MFYLQITTSIFFSGEEGGIRYVIELFHLDDHLN